MFGFSKALIQDFNANRKFVAEKDTLFQMREYDIDGRYNDKIYDKIALYYHDPELTAENCKAICKEFHGHARWCDEVFQYWTKTRTQRHRLREIRETLD